MGFLKLELYNTCHEPSPADSPNSFSSDNLLKVHFLPLLVGPADGPPPQQQSFSERISQLTHEEKPFYKRVTKTRGMVEALPLEIPSTQLDNIPNRLLYTTTL